MGGECNLPALFTVNGRKQAPINHEVLHAMKYYTSTTQFNCGIDLHARQMYVYHRAGRLVWLGVATPDCI